MKEVEKAIRKGQANLLLPKICRSKRVERTNKFDLNVDQVILRPVHGADIAKKKADKDKMNFKAAEKVLSPRSLQPRRRRRRRSGRSSTRCLAKLEKELRPERTAAKWLNSRGVGHRRTFARILRSASPATTPILVMSSKTERSEIERVLNEANLGGLVDFPSSSCSRPPGARSEHTASAAASSSTLHAVESLTVEHEVEGVTHFGRQC